MISGSLGFRILNRKDGKITVTMIKKKKKFDVIPRQILRPLCDLISLKDFIFGDIRSGKIDFDLRTNNREQRKLQ